MYIYSCVCVKGETLKPWVLTLNSLFSVCWWRSDLYWHLLVSRRYGAINMVSHSPIPHLNPRPSNQESSALPPALPEPFTHVFVCVSVSVCVWWMSVFVCVCVCVCVCVVDECVCVRVCVRFCTNCEDFCILIMYNYVVWRELEVKHCI